mmetsp:Transcript_125803/g.361732  ORF Transcript_125803/g.361732 Transcript_125803/m.361732 type:complete len:294 (+) Transcript_125803:773-1654(+)
MLFFSMEAHSAVRGIQFTAERELQEEARILLVAVRLVQLDDEGGVAHQLHGFLAEDTLLHPRLDDVALAQDLHRIGFTRLPMLHELHRAEAPATQQTDDFQILQLDLAEAPVRWQGGLGRLGPRRSGSAGAVVALQFPQGPEEHVERLAVEHQRLGGLGGHEDRRCAVHGLQQRTLAEEGSLLGRRLQPANLRAVLDYGHFALHEDVEGVPLVPLREDGFALAEEHLIERVRQSLLLLQPQRVQDLHFVQILYVFQGHVRLRLRQDLLEVFSIDDPHDGADCGAHRGVARGQV